MGLTTNALERWTEGKQSAENPNSASLTDSVSNISLRSSERSSQKSLSGAHSESNAVPSTNPVSSIRPIPGASLNAAQPQGSIIRQNYSHETEAAINRQINLELHASYVYLSMSCYFDRGDTSLPNTAKWLKKHADEKHEHAQTLLKYQNTRGGRVIFQNIQKPEVDEWGSALESFQAALALEKFTNDVLLELYSLASQCNDHQLCNFLQNELLNQQVGIIEKISKIVTTLKKVGSGLGEFIFDHLYFKN